MKLKINLRTLVPILFIGLYFGSLLVYNSIGINQQDEVKRILNKTSLDKDFASLSFSTKEDSIKAREVLVNFRSSIASLEAIQNKNRRYSAIFLFFMLIIVVTIFISVFYKITNPLKELNDATIQIRRGNFSVNLSETGLPEMKQLKQSFNSMSGELDLVQRKLLEAEKEMIWKELSRVLAHEIKNPLTPIQLSIQRLGEKFENDEKRFKEIFPESASIILQETENLRCLVKQFSDFAKTQQPEPIIFNATEYLGEIVKSYQHNYNIKLELDDCDLKYDQTHFYQIITNILQNALDVSPEDEEVTIKLYKSKSFIVLKITDKGEGIAKEDLDRIFEPYFSKKKEGTGLGLALVKKLVDANNGYIRVHSKEGEGSTFELIMDGLVAN